MLLPLQGGVLIGTRKVLVRTRTLPERNVLIIIITYQDQEDPWKGHFMEDCLKICPLMQYLWKNLKQKDLNTVFQGKLTYNWVSVKERFFEGQVLPGRTSECLGTGLVCLKTSDLLVQLRLTVTCVRFWWQRYQLCLSTMGYSVTVMSMGCVSSTCLCVTSRWGCEQKTPVWDG